MHTVNKKFKRIRLLLWLLLTIVYVLSYFHRVALSVISDQLMAEFTMKATTFGILAAIYSYMFIFLQIPGGAFLDRWGPRIVIIASSLLIGSGSLLFAFSDNIISLFASRFVIGLGCSTVLITIFKFQASWFRKIEFATMSGLVIFIGNIGHIIASKPLAIAVEIFSWREPFIIVSFISILVAIACILLIKNTPQEAGFTLNNYPEIKQINKDLIDDNKMGLVRGTILTLTNIHIWPPFLINFGLYGTFIAFTGAWGVPYLMQIYNLTRENAANFMLIAAIGVMLGSPTVGFISDRLKRRKFPIQIVIALYCFIWALLLFWPTGFFPFYFLYPSFFLLGFGIAGYIPLISYVKEISTPELAGTGMATATMGNFLGIAVIQMLFGYFLDYYWEGIILEGVKIYSLVAYRPGLILCFIFSLVSFMTTFFLKEEKQHYFLKKF